MKFIPGQMTHYLDPKLLESDSELSEEDKQKIQLSRALDFRTLYNYCGTPEASTSCTLDVTTAARLSASFPYVSPMARNYPDNLIKDFQTGKPMKDPTTDKITMHNYHMADGGYFDNSGAFTAIEWLNDFLKNKPQDESKCKEKNYKCLNIKKVVLLQINAFPEEPLKSREEGEKGLLTVLKGSLDTLSAVRDSTQIDRNIQAVKLLQDSWNDNGHNINIGRFAISFPKEDHNQNKYDQPLSWQLTQHQKDNLKDAWENDQIIEKTVKRMKAFWNNDQTEDKEVSDEALPITTNFPLKQRKPSKKDVGIAENAITKVVLDAMPLLY
ncbi:hypothetical protein [Crocosphaera sp. XPORK-15E]|uniref:hypothetical protein n=1 Tax=Crocosphaera sp. XPORK-15E TaxID=3110247 RepID=UPI002B1FB419|nr:hypothetical protein [Crocosphaera sp. XPORK-15E]MEA5537004.1 hypothetical protein [Crocosphaera sp. XPORK-15E]